jgi:energy-converting hydrogenase A subunit M
MIKPLVFNKSQTQWSTTGDGFFPTAHILKIEDSKYLYYFMDKTDFVGMYAYTTSFIEAEKMLNQYWKIKVKELLDENLHH